jgi:hypothetical protein
MIIKSLWVNAAEGNLSSFISLYRKRLKTASDGSKIKRVGTDVCLDFKRIS